VTVLPAHDFPEFSDENPLTWEMFIERLVAEELNQYATAVALVSTYKEDTVNVVRRFQYSQANADVIFSTVHAAKGMEWDHVEVLDDMTSLAHFAAPERAHTEARATEARAKHILNMKHKDGLAIFYVAVTRARKSLIVPHSFQLLMRAYHAICGFAESPHPTELQFFLPPFESDVDAKNFNLPFHFRPSQCFSWNQIQALHRDLVRPWLDYGTLQRQLMQLCVREHRRGDQEALDRWDRAWKQFWSGSPSASQPSVPWPCAVLSTTLSQGEREAASRVARKLALRLHPDKLPDEALLASRFPSQAARDYFRREVRVWFDRAVQALDR